MQTAPEYSEREILAMCSVCAVLCVRACCVVRVCVESCTTFH